ncbi:MULTISPECIES: YbaB/EbfC family nucleoid-associated protein [Kordiimonas]|uniref:YbaB/EbfC family nucleoid-associated protein n=1 Tax=Kordiimonas TaxID=288021 RepID=UPI001FF28E30|nr:MULTISPECIES: YbaB/EbfC family nucleoid-associated protein [Kordiimonas]MCK0069197.1 YbaB/EbfC family nucleoid-associated protein [Kordiimonas laminariae]UTW58530.1 YbaB/EbfC family nucleoid-associated protein [Kordiimonas sp. SCSIO 12603]
MKMTEMLKKAQEMQAKMGDMQAELDNMEVEGVAGAGLVKVVLSGKGDMKSVKIDDSLYSSEDREVLEDLILAAHNQAKAKVADAAANQMKDITGGLDLGGMKMPF